MRKQEIDHILTKMLDSFQNVSDLNLTPGKPLQVESSGELAPVEMNPNIKELTPFQTEIFALNLINQDRRLTEILLETGSCDLSYTLPGKARFRVNIFSQGSNYSIVLRKLESKIPTIKELNLPEAMHKIAAEKNGIVFVTGATGSGKTTSLAAVLDEINDKKSVHVVTLEDPVEYQHPHKKATFNQRELGQDFDSFANGLRAALRQAPKVILVGEMRDRETVEIGLNAAETGHLVLTTLHTIDAGSTINRIVGMFKTEEELQIRMRLADTVRWIVSQRLLPKVGRRTNRRIRNSGGQPAGQGLHPSRRVGRQDILRHHGGGQAFRNDNIRRIHRGTVRTRPDHPRYRHGILFQKRRRRKGHRLGKERPWRDHDGHRKIGNRQRVRPDL